jgi:hypothetical protein
VDDVVQRTLGDQKDMQQELVIGLQYLQKGELKLLVIWGFWSEPLLGRS